MTPMHEQYNKIKSEYPNSILLFRLGDFYEIFDEDALIASKILGITLTGRGKDENRRPMAGIPHHALPNYLPKLIEAKLKTVIVEQTEDAQPGKLVDRKVTRVITPGTVMDVNSLDDSKNNYIACIRIAKLNEKKDDKYYFFITYADLSTGELNCFYSQNASFIKQELEKLSPAELITNEVRSTLLIYDKAFVSELPKNFSLQEADTLLKNHFGTQKINFLLPADLIEDIKSEFYKTVAELIFYLNDSQKTKNKHISKINYKDFSPFALINYSSIQNLEIFNTNSLHQSTSLYNVLNQCLTSMGKRLLRQWLLSPLKRKDDIDSRLKRVELYYNNSILIQDIRSLLNQVGDVERLCSKIGNNTVNPKEIKSLSNYLRDILNIQQILKDHDNILTDSDVLNISTIIDIISNTLTDDPAISAVHGSVVRSGYLEEIDKLRSLAKNSKQALLEMQMREIETTGIASLKIAYNQVFGYYIEISKTNLSKVPKHYIRKQTLANAERFITEELKNLEVEILNASSKLIDMENEIFRELILKLSEQIEICMEASKKTAELDVIVNFAHISRERRYTKPIFSEQQKIKNGRHPVVESLVDRFVANDTHFDKDGLIHIITGPNMSGKSTYIRQVALIYLMAQIGCFVPADSFEFDPVEKIFTRIGTADNLSKGESTFMVEMIETANILNNSNQKSLIILDEVGRGTSTYDGVAIAWSVIEYISSKIKAKTLFATHYHEVTSLEETSAGVKNFTVEVKEEEKDICFLHKIIPGSANKSYGVHVAKMAGVPSEVISRANDILNKFESENSILPNSKVDKSNIKSPKKPKSIHPEQLNLW
jgi:DNA mismatch repair protein MutS